MVSYEHIVIQSGPITYRRDIECLYGSSDVKIANINKKDYIPLLTEGQLRKFIEDKTRSYFSCEIINPLVNEEGFRFVFEFYSGKEFKYNEKLRKEIYAIDLLQAYWQVACKIAKENIDN